MLGSSYFCRIQIIVNHVKKNIQKTLYFIVSEKIERINKPFIRTQTLQRNAAYLGTFLLNETKG